MRFDLSPVPSEIRRELLISLDDVNQAAKVLLAK